MGTYVGYECIGLMYYDGSCVDQDYQKAYEYFMKSEMELPETRFKLAQMYENGLYVEKDFGPAKKYYEDVVASFDEQLAEEYNLVDDYYGKAKEKLAQMK